MSQMLIFFLFLFRLKQVEIQIDPDAKSPDQIMDNLKKLRSWVQISGYSFMMIKVIFIVCYSGINIVEIYVAGSSDEMDQLQRILKTVLISINGPCNLVIVYMYFQFFLMGNRFLYHFQKCNQAFHRNVGRLVVATATLAFMTQVVLNCVYFLYPTIMNWM